MQYIAPNSYDLKKQQEKHLNPQNKGMSVFLYLFLYRSKILNPVANFLQVLSIAAIEK